jgi:hypothetical protein
MEANPDDYPGGPDDSWAPKDLGTVLERLADPDHEPLPCPAARYCCAPGACMTAGRRTMPG